MSAADTPSVPALAPGGGRAVARPPARRPTLPDRIRAAVNNRENNEFLPAHLEILETPPSPYLMVFTWVICAILASALAWSILARLDIHAVAQGRIQPSGRSKVVQPLETSKVKSILVTNGTAVKAGDLLVELDPAEAEADLNAKRSAVQTFDAQILRYRAAIAAIQAQRPSTGAELQFPSGIDPTLQERERAAMVADVSDYINTRSSLQSQLAEKQATQQRYTSSIAARQQLKAVLDERVDMKKTLAATSSGTRAALLDAQQQADQAAADLAYDVGQLKEAEAAARSIERRFDQLQSTTVAKQSQSLVEASEKRVTAQQDTVKAALRLDRTHLKAPIDGTVQQLAVTTVGQVVTPGQALLVVVPSSGPIEVNALVLNKDIGFVVPGQDVVVKVDAFPFTRYGMLEGKVVSVSRDAIDSKEASSDTVTASRGQSVDPVSGTPATQNLVFPVTVQLDRSTMEADGKVVPLTAGMTVSAEIRTGSRRVIDYVLAPIKETASTAGHER